MRLGITGAHGLLGWHASCVAKTHDDVVLVRAGRESFASDVALDDFVRGCDVILHFAGMNRGDDAEIEATNPRLARELVAACERQSATPHVLYSNSIHEDRDTPYGRSKRGAHEVFRAWTERSGAPYTSLVLPHVFGEQGKPFYNSVVSTFCHQLATGETPQVTHDGQLELLHAQDVAHAAFECIESGRVGTVRLTGREILVSQLLTKLQGFAERYAEDVVPDVRDPTDLRLFNTYRQYLYTEHYPVSLQLRSDDRGNLVEAVKTDHGGQTFFSTTRPGITRGNHFHLAKIERFLVLRGEATIQIRRLFDDDVQEFRVSGDQPEYIDIPTLHTHNITNVGNSELLTLFWAHEVFDPEAPDTIFERVEDTP